MCVFLHCHTSRVEKPTRLILGAKFKFRGSRVSLLTHLSHQFPCWVIHLPVPHLIPQHVLENGPTPKVSRASVDPTGSTVHKGLGKIQVQEHKQCKVCLSLSTAYFLIEVQGYGPRYFLIFITVDTA